MADEPPKQLTAPQASPKAGDPEVANSLLRAFDEWASAAGNSEGAELIRGRVHEVACDIKMGRTADGEVPSWIPIRV